MDDLESKIGSILENPETMQKIMALAQSLNAGQGKDQKQPPPKQQNESPVNAFPDLDLSFIQKLSGLAKQSGIDKNEQSLLAALRPYLSRERINKLEKAMRAAKMARMATTIIGTGR